MLAQLAQKLGDALSGPLVLSVDVETSAQLGQQCFLLSRSERSVEGGVQSHQVLEWNRWFFRQRLGQLLAPLPRLPYGGGESDGAIDGRFPVIDDLQLAHPVDHHVFDRTDLNRNNRQA